MQQKSAEKSAKTEEKRITPADVASHYGVSRWTVGQWLAAGLPCERLGARTVRLQLSVVEAWLANRGVK